MAWPVKDSSTSVLSRPVWSHCSTKRGRDRRVMSRMRYSESGMLTSATSARGGEMTNMMMIVPTSMNVFVNSWLMVCCRLWARLSMSLVTRLRRSPRAERST